MIINTYGFSGLDNRLVNNGMGSVDWGDIAGQGVSQSITSGLDILHDQYGMQHAGPGQTVQVNRDGSYYASSLPGASAGMGVGLGISTNTLLLIGLGLMVFMVMGRGK